MSVQTMEVADEKALERGAKVKARREDCGLTQLAVAREAGVSTATLSLRERGEVPMDVAYARKFNRVITILVQRRREKRRGLPEERR